MNLFQAMRVFERVASLGSFAGAARDLGLSTTAVSRQVMDLEADLGIRLLNRSTRRLHLTEAGESYHRRAQALLEELETLQASTREFRGEPAGTLRVTATISMGQNHLYRILPGFIERYPKVSVELEVANRFVDLIGEGYDVGIRIGVLRDSGLVARKLGTRKFLLCAAPSYIARHGEPEAPGDVSNHHCILDTVSQRRSRINFMTPEGPLSVPVQGRYWINDMVAVGTAVRQGLGIASLPSFQVAGDLAEGRLVRLLADYELEADPIHAVYPHRSFLAAKIRVFLDYLVETLSPELAEPLPGTN